MMMLREGRAGVLVVAVSAFTLLGARAPLNPTVKLLKTPTSPVPAECAEGLAPAAAPRINIAEIPEAPSREPMPAPPSASLRDQLQEALNAVQRHDHDGFNAAAARAKATLQSYPSGGERNAAAEVVRVLDDIDQLWTYEFENKNGAFFDASSSMLPMMNTYPGYAKAIADKTLTVNGVKLYPARESRDFLSREAQSRMSRLAGGRAPAPVAAAPAPKSTVIHVPGHAVVKKASPVHALPVVKPKAKPKAKPNAKPEEPPPVVATATTAPPPVPVPAPVPPTTTIATTTTASTTTEAPPTQTTATETAATTASVAPSPSTPAKSTPFRNVILPIILIVVGVGVLIVLFRASS